ncbi:hypothetical protein JTB14_015905 [Gonioctena quinquepunctata]|nr:hypothetical protein JTB14_015905 [Gonioctena quinquepunctata]
MEKIIKGLDNSRDGDAKQIDTPDFSQPSTSSELKHYRNIELIYDDKDGDEENIRYSIDLEEVAAENKRRHVDYILTEKKCHENNWERLKVKVLQPSTGDVMH